MLTKRLAPPIFTVLLSACGGGGGGNGESTSNQAPSIPDPEPEALVGVFIDSAVEGLYYETASRSGLTNQRGEFEYLAGEVVRFSVGGIPLGSAQGSPRLTPFSLTGINPLQNETEIVASLSSSTVNSFDRAINIAMLLQSLDQDGSPDNGIDLGNANTLLESDFINLFVKAPDFLTQNAIASIREKTGVNHATELAGAVQHMYDSLGVEIASTRVAAFESVLNNEVVETISYEYDENGNLLAQQTDIDNDGVNDFSKTFEYDSSGNLTRIEDSSTSSVEEISYDDEDRIIARSIDKPNSENDQSESYSYQEGRLVQLEVETNNQLTSSTRYSYNETGQLSEYVKDLDGDGNIDLNARYAYQNGEVSEFSQDNNNDGTADLVISYTYDANGNRTSQSNATMDGNGNPSSTSQFSYDDNGNVVNYSQDRNLDGQVDYIEDYRYNSRNQRTQYRRDLDADGRWDSVAQYRYDVNGNRTRMIEDSDGDGIVDKIWEGTYQSNPLQNAWTEIVNQL